MERGEHRAAQQAGGDRSEAARERGEREAAEEQLLAQRRRHRYRDNHRQGLLREEEIEGSLERIEILHPALRSEGARAPGDERDHRLVRDRQQDGGKKVLAGGSAQAEDASGGDARHGERHEGRQRDGQDLGRPQAGDDVALLGRAPDGEIADPQGGVCDECARRAGWGTRLFRHGPCAHTMWRDRRADALADAPRYAAIGCPTTITCRQAACGG